jgi:hypothetical protein
MWFIRKILWMLLLPFMALTGILLFAFPEEVKEFKKDIVDMFEPSWLTGLGFALFVFATTHIARIFDGKHTLVRFFDPNN